MINYVARAQAITAAFFELVAKTENGVRYSSQFPRNIEALVLHTFEVPIEYRTEITTSTADHYLCVLRGGQYTAGQTREERPLFGLLHVGPPFNIIFVKEGLSVNVRNYVLAHELGHFFADIYSLRSLWLRALPEQAESILRAFSWQPFDDGLELQALIKGLPLRPEPILDRGAAEHPKTVEREIMADLIAREMIAPWEIALQRYQNLDKLNAIQSFRHEFGLPWRVAENYYDDLRRHFDPYPDVITRLFSRYLGSTESPALQSGIGNLPRKSDGNAV